MRQPDDGAIAQCDGAGRLHNHDNPAAAPAEPGMIAAAAERELRTHVAEALHLGTAPRWSRVGTGAWTQTYRIDDEGATYFVKTGAGRFAQLLDAEADGLRAIASTRTMRTPAIIGAGTFAGVAFLVLEWLDAGAAIDGASFGVALASMHRARAPRGPAGERYGWTRDNWIGGTPQRNAWCDDWAAFFRDARLAPQFDLAVRRGHRGALERGADRLLAAVPALLRGHEPAPALLHGDLWSGNAASLRDGAPAIFDPAVYVGDREADLAMTELFGGFGSRFRAAYEEAWPTPDGASLRSSLYNLYHVLNHLNLFGERYRAQAERATEALVAQAG
jgi:fructosamine-3-kinase